MHFPVTFASAPHVHIVAGDTTARRYVCYLYRIRVEHRGTARTQTAARELDLNLLFLKGDSVGPYATVHVVRERREGALRYGCGIKDNGS